MRQSTLDKSSRTTVAEFARIPSVTSAACRASEVWRLPLREGVLREKKRASRKNEDMPPQTQSRRSLCGNQPNQTAVPLAGLRSRSPLSATPVIHANAKMQPTTDAASSHGGQPGPSRRLKNDFVNRLLQCCPPLVLRWRSMVSPRIDQPADGLKTRSDQ